MGKYRPSRGEALHEIKEILEGYKVYIPGAAKTALDDALYWLDQDTAEMKQNNKTMPPVVATWNGNSALHWYTCGFCGKLTKLTFDTCTFCNRKNIRKEDKQNE